MKRTILCVIIFIVAPNISEARAQNLDLNKYDTSTFSNLSAILGQILGSGFYHSANIHKFGGVDIGLKIMNGFIQNEDRNGPLEGIKFVSMPVLQANVGILNRFEIGGRLFSASFGDENKEDVRFTSGLVKYNFLSGIGLPDITLFSAYSRLSGINDFSFDILTVGGIIGKKIPVITIYAGVNRNIITMDVDLVPDAGQYPDGFSESFKENVTHYSLGISLGLTPFTKMNIEYNNGEVHTATFGIILTIN